MVSWGRTAFLDHNSGSTMDSVAMVAEMDVMQRSNIISSNSLRLMYLLTQPHITLAGNGNWHWYPSMAPALRESHHTLGKLKYTGNLPPWKRQWFISTGIDTYAKYEFLFCAQKISASTTIHGLTEYLTLWHRVLCNVALDHSTTYVKWDMEVSM